MLPEHIPFLCDKTILIDSLLSRLVVLSGCYDSPDALEHLASETLCGSVCDKGDVKMWRFNKAFSLRARTRVTATVSAAAVRELVQ